MLSQQRKEHLTLTLVNKAYNGEEVKVLAGEIKGLDWIFNEVDYLIKKGIKPIN